MSDVHNQAVEGSDEEWMSPLSLSLSNSLSLVCQHGTPKSITTHDEWREERIRSFSAIPFVSPKFYSLHQLREYANGALKSEFTPCLSSRGDGAHQTANRLTIPRTLIWATEPVLIIESDHIDTISFHSLWAVVLAGHQSHVECCPDDRLCYPSAISYPCLVMIVNVACVAWWRRSTSGPREREGEEGGGFRAAMTSGGCDGGGCGPRPSPTASPSIRLWAGLSLRVACRSPDWWALWVGTVATVGHGKRASTGCPGEALSDNRLRSMPHSASAAIWFLNLFLGNVLTQEDNNVGAWTHAGLWVGRRP